MMTVKEILEKMEPGSMVQLRNEDTNIRGSAIDLLNVVDEGMLKGQVTSMEARILNIPHYSQIGYINIYWKEGVL